VKQNEKIQVKIKVIYTLEVNDDFDYTEPSEVQDALAEYLGRNNMTADNEFYENYSVIKANNTKPKREYRVWATGYPRGQGSYIMASSLEEAIKIVKKSPRGKYIKSFNGKLWRNG